MYEERVSVGGHFGLNGHHSALVKATASRHASEVARTSQGRMANAKDAMSVMTLRAQSGAIVHITAIGLDEIEAVQVLANGLSAADPA